jgi:chaperone LolA
MSHFTIKLSVICAACFAIAACGHSQHNKSASTSHHKVPTKSVLAVQKPPVKLKHKTVMPPANKQESKTDNLKLQQNAQDLLRRLRSYTSLSADFTQVNIAHTAVGDTKKSQRGHMDLKRPDDFIWKTYDGQSGTTLDEALIGDGDKYWQYDPDLQQAIKEKGDLSRQPLIKLLLSNDYSSKELTKSFMITKQSVAGEPREVEFTLTPVSTNMDINVSAISIVFNNDTLSELVMQNSLNQKTVFNFYNIKRTPLSSSLFAFKPGKDVDVIDNT